MAGRGGNLRLREVFDRSVDRASCGDFLTSSALSATLVEEKLTQDVPQ